MARSVALAGAVLVLAQACSAEVIKIVKSATVDLNGDGKPEKISFSASGSDIDYVLKVGALSAKGKLLAADGFRVVDIDGSDRRKEIAVHTSGPSDDVSYHIYSYDGKKIGDMGELPGQTRFPGNGTALVSKRIDFSFATEKYVPDKTTHKLRAVPQEMYYVGLTVTIGKSFPLYFSPGSPNVVANLQPKSKAMIIAYSPAQREPDRSFKTGPKDYYLIKSHTGIMGWATSKDVSFENISDLPAFD